MQRRDFLAHTAAVAAGTALIDDVAHAQADFPNRNITIVAPFPAGSTTDITARLIAQKIAGPLGRTVIVENKPGANGSIGMQAVARAQPDGHTLVVGTVSSTVVAKVIQKTLGFDLQKDFVPVAVVATTTVVLITAKESPFNSVADVVAAAKKAPDTLTYGNSAGLYRIAMEALNQQAGISLTAVAYKGPPDAINDLLGGRLSVTPDSLGSATRLIQSGRVRALAVMSSKRHPSLPDVPTMQELGFKDFTFDSWLGLLAPAGTPPAVVQRLSDEIARAVADPEVQRQFRAVSLDPLSLGPREYAQVLARESEKYDRIGRDAQIEKQ